MFSTYSLFSLLGLVSSNRRLHTPLYFSATPKSMQMALACPMCKYPLGSGGKRVWIRPPFFPAARSSSTNCSTKLRLFFSSFSFSSVTAINVPYIYYVCKVTAICVKNKIKLLLFLLPRVPSVVPGGPWRPSVAVTADGGEAKWGRLLNSVIKPIVFYWKLVGVEKNMYFCKSFH